MNPLHLVLALAVVMIWGVNFVVIRFGLEVIPPILFTTLRFGLCTFPLIFWVRRPVVRTRLLFGFAVAQFVFQFTLLFTGMKLGITPGLASLLIQSQVFFTIGLSMWLFRERPEGHQIAGAAIALAGIVLVACFIGTNMASLGLVLVLGGAVSWAFANILTKQMGNVDALSLVTWASAIAFPILLVSSLIFEGPARDLAALRAMDTVRWLSVLYQSWPNTLFAFAVWSYLLRRYPTAMVTPFALLVPIVGMASASVLGGEPMQWWKLAAGGLVIVGLAVNLFGKRWIPAAA